MSQLALQNSDFFAPSTDQVLGRTEPRIFTPPLRKLEPAVIDEEGNVLQPATTYGFGVIDFARDVLGTPLDEWEEFAVIHGGELLPNGKPRFRKLLIIVARQNGKTFLLDVLVKYWLFVEVWPVILGTSNSRGNARKAWEKSWKTALMNPFLRGDLDAKPYRSAAGAEVFYTNLGSEYYFAAPNGDCGRSMTVDRLVLDELRQQRTWEVWASAYNAMNARPFGQVIAITNQGDDRGIVLDSLRNEAHRFINTGKGDRKLGILEWSAPEGSSALDPEALAYANPNLNRRLDLEDLISEGERCLDAGGEELDKFLTEVLCIRIKAFNGAINPEAWKAGYVAGDLRTLKERLALFIDVTPGPSGHIALVGAARLADDRIRVETIRAWDGPDASTAMRQSLPGVLKRSGARRLGWMPNSETVKFGPDLRKMRIGGVVIEEITSEVAEVCMSFAEQVESGHIVYGDDEEMLTDHVTGAFKKFSGEKWRFSRQGKGDCNAAYAAAGAVYLARTMPGPTGPVRGFVRST